MSAARAGRPARVDAGGRLRVTWLGHSTVVLDLAGPGGATTRLVTDPLLHRHAGLLRRRGQRPAELAWKGADAVLLSHLHHDHAELRSLRLLGDVPVLAASSSARWLRGRGVRGVALEGAWVVAGRVETWRSGPWHDVGGVQVRLAPAVHGHRPMPHRPNAATGHLVRLRGRGAGTGAGAAGPTVWAMGDTERFGSMGRVRDLAGGRLDVALVPVSGWGPRLSGGHLGPWQAAEVCAEAGVGVAIPVHWGTLHAPGGRHLPRGWMDRAGDAFAAAAARVAPATDVVVLRPGESWAGEPQGW
ncbi:MBL fold metallo-hydrolase [Isoptericola sp. NEAU-Y5]|uniref:MBL fold metallo-hydrolase n=1 Tax=Isoptericola luteus TaxID=2879484 RepID=A0ABS7ZDS0_9MICO|nr:MBL fold metallo-hydrolase [Isoptericola sp. NEAU-Y5]MCA5893191.1 MBL fold metallo-hydrolase [Isoptericola sp. NEAU-Y5]